MEIKLSESFQFSTSPPATGQALSRRFTQLSSIQNHQNVIYLVECKKNRQIQKERKNSRNSPISGEILVESHQKQEINNAGLRRKSPLVLEINWSKVTFK